jgi:hypothetical protein
MVRVLYIIKDAFVKLASVELRVERTKLDLPTPPQP